MRFIVISDVHGRDKVIRLVNRLVKQHQADAVLVLGDITHFGPAEWAGEFLSQLDATTYALPGNCDPPGVLEQIERHAISLHRKKIMLEGRAFVGHGGSNPTIFETPFEMSEDKILEGLRPLAERGMVLVTHAPAYGYLDLVPAGNRHAGSVAILKIVKDFAPAAAVSGHIHEARGQLLDHDTVFMNPGPAKDLYAGILDVGEKVEGRLLDRSTED
ncbi:MAG TPA: metallophosphoesterase [Methanomassiliicoccales archaeon]|nr:metallophosphoesterase [Methanomassiliicoccales archaeon]